MALTGPAAKPSKLGHSPTADWTDVTDVPYDDKGAHALPKSPGGRRKWHQQVVDWWEEVRQMPHCALWTPTDWRFALDTAHMREHYWRELDEGEMKSTLATEIRRREDQMGTTAEARRKLRIRYVSPEDANKRQHQVSSPAGTGPAGADVVSMADRRARLTG